MQMADSEWHGGSGTNRCVPLGQRYDHYYIDYESIQ
jgi:hypothetical protein